MTSPRPLREGGPTPWHGASQIAWLAVVVLIGLNLRPFLTGIGPVVASIRSSTGLDYRGIAWLTLLPMLLMGVAAFFAPSLLRAVGGRVTVLGALVLLGLGSALRGVAPGGATLIATAALCGLGVALIQSAFPGIIKREFHDHVAPVTGLYSATLMGGGALARRSHLWSANGPAVGASRWPGGLCRSHWRCCWHGVCCRAMKRPSPAQLLPRHYCGARAPGC